MADLRPSEYGGESELNRRQFETWNRKTTNHFGAPVFKWAESFFQRCHLYLRWARSGVVTNPELFDPLLATPRYCAQRARILST